MPIIQEIMSSHVQVIKPEATLREAAEKMKDIGCGAIPVCEGDRLIGMVTDRDIVVRALAAGKDPTSVLVREVMSSPITYCFEDEELSRAAQLMKSKQIRRLVVLNRNKRLVGVISLSDIARKGGSESLSAQTLEKVSMPAQRKVA